MNKLYKDVSLTTHSNEGASRANAPSHMTVAVLSKFHIAAEYKHVIACNVIQKSATS